MCGLAGFDGIKDSKARSVLAMALAIGIDSRGGDSLGGALWVRGARRVVRALGRWDGVQGEILDSLLSAQTAMLHARMATLGKVNVENAHPFTITRDGKRVLIGAHNGVIDTADVRRSARKHGRELTVDSREAFELLADGKLDDVRALRGYGVLTWVDPRERARCVRVVRATSDGQLCVKGVEGGGVVYASTERIVDDALKAAGLEANVTFDVKVGVVYQVRDGGLWFDADWEGKAVTFAERWTAYGGASYGGVSSWTSQGYPRAWDYDDSEEWRWDASERRIVRDVATRVDWRRLYQDAVDGDTSDGATCDGATCDADAATDDGLHELTDEEVDTFVSDPMFQGWCLEDFVSFVRRNRST